MEKFTVVIPTRDRSDTLGDTIATCMAQVDENFRILVSDNHSSDATCELVHDLQNRDNRIAYIRPPGPMDMSGHYEFVLSQVKDGFVILLGSDDGLLPGSVARARACLQEYPSIEALHSTAPTFYYPGMVEGHESGVLLMNVSPGMEIRKSAEWLPRVSHMTCGVTSLPYVYQTTWVRTAVFDRIRAKSGRLIHAVHPDVFLAIAVASEIDEFLHVNRSFGIGGYSRKSNCMAVIHPQGSRSIEKDFQEQSVIQFHPKIGYSRLISVMVGECLLRAKEAGLLPAGFLIPWDRIIARGYQQFLAESWQPHESNEMIGSLRVVAETMGCRDLMLALSHCASEGELLSLMPCLAEWHEEGFRLRIATRSLQIQNVLEAARFADALQQVAQDTAAAPPSWKDGTSGEIGAWQLLQQEAEFADLQNQFRHAGVESRRVAAKREEAKARLADLRTQEKQFRATIKTASKRPPMKSWSLRRLWSRRKSAT